MPPGRDPWYPRGTRPARRAGLAEASTDPIAIIGREPELAALRSFLDGEGTPQALVLAGGPGFGKTTLWAAGADAARERHMRVLAARPSEAEAQLSFAALIDLFDEVDVAELEGPVPAPQRRALDVALLRAEPTGEPPEPHAIAVGFLNALRGLAAAKPIVVAVDDVPWLDRPSGETLAFAARRLQGHDVRFLLARRPGAETSLERALEGGGQRRIEVGPLEPGGDAAAPVRAARPDAATAGAPPDRRFDAGQSTLCAGAWARGGRARACGAGRGHPGARHGGGPAGHPCRGARRARAQGLARHRAERRPPGVGAHGDRRFPRARRRLRRRPDRPRTGPRAPVPPTARRGGEETLAGIRAPRAASGAGRRGRGRGAPSPSPRPGDREPRCGACGRRGPGGGGGVGEGRAAGGRGAGRARAPPDAVRVARPCRPPAHARRLPGSGGRAAARVGPAHSRARLAAARQRARPCVAASRRGRQRQDPRRARESSRVRAGGLRNRPGTAGARAGDEGESCCRQRRLRDPRRGGVGHGGAAGFATRRTRGGAEGTARARLGAEPSRTPDRRPVRALPRRIRRRRSDRQYSSARRGPAARLARRGEPCSGDVHQVPGARGRARRAAFVRSAPSAPVRARAPHRRVGRRSATPGRVGRVLGGGAADLADVRALPGAPCRRARASRRGGAVGR